MGIETMAPNLRNFIVDELINDMSLSRNTFQFARRTVFRYFKITLSPFTGRHENMLTSFMSKVRKQPSVYNFPEI
jgi:hypothetical protein